MKHPISTPVNIQGVENVWCTNFLSGKSFILLNIVLTTSENIINKKYTFICHYRGGVYISQYDTLTIQTGISLWKKNYMYPQELTLEQRKELFQKIDNQCISTFIKGITNVWQNEFLIGGNSLWLIIIDTSTNKILLTE